MMISQNKQQIEIKINSLNINGEAVSTFNGKKVCLKNALPSEKVLARIEQEKSNFILAKLDKVLDASSKRINPACPYYNVCGGCDFQMISDNDAIMLKQEIITKYLSSFYSGKIEIEKCENTCNYRNKMSFYVDKNKIGLIQENTNKIVEVDYCLIASLQINKTLKILKEFLNINKINQLTHIVIREINNNFILTLVCNSNLEYIKKVASFLKDKLLENCDNSNFGIYVNFNKSKNKILGEEWYHVFGLEYLSANILGIDFYVHPYSFLQVNFQIMKKLYSEVCKKINKKVVIEGYSGAGLLSCIMAKRAQKVISVEINKSATRSANITKKINNIKNLENINADCKNILPKLTQTYPNSTFVLDPARSGCDKEILTALNDSDINQIIYISCNPYTLKQNLGILEQNYSVESVKLYDMFPKTSHIETLVVLKRKRF